MYKYYDFLCPDGHVASHLVDENQKENGVQCKTCDKLAKRCPSAPHISASMGTDPNSAQGNRWAKMHREEAKRQNAKLDPNS